MFVLRLRNIVYDTTGGRSALPRSALRSAGQLGEKLLVGRRMRSIGTSTRTGSIHHKNENLWETLGAIMVNGPPWELPWVVMESLRRILKVPLGISLGGPSIFSLGTPLSTLGKLPWGSIHHDVPSGFSQIVPCSQGVSGPFWIPLALYITLNDYFRISYNNRVWGVREQQSLGRIVPEWGHYSPLYPSLTRYYLLEPRVSTRTYYLDIAAI